MTSSGTRLSFKERLAYGCGDVSAASVSSILGFFHNYFLVTTACLDPVTTGTVLLVSKVWDAVNDPLIGWLSDKTKNGLGLGKRRSWMCLGCVPFGITYVLQWVTLSESAGMGGKAAYYIVVSIALDTFYTAVNMPYGAMTAELTTDYHERTVLNKFRFMFSLQAGVFALLVFQICMTIVGGKALGYILQALVLMVFFIWLPTIITVRGLSRVDQAHGSIKGSKVSVGTDNDADVDEQHTPNQEDTDTTFFKSLQYAMTYKPFRLVMCIYLCAWLGISFVQNFLAFYFTYALELPSSFIICILVLMESGFICMAFWMPFAKNYGKKNTFYCGAVCFGVVLLCLFFAPSRSFTFALVMCLLTGPGLAVMYIIPWSMLPDVCDAHEVERGKRQEGVFYGFFVLFQKLGLALGAAVGNLILASSGFVQGKGSCAKDTASEVGDTSKGMVCDVELDCSGRGMCKLDSQEALGEFPCVCESGWVGPNCDQPESVVGALRAMVSFMPIFMLALGCIAVWAFPIDEAMHKKNVQLLAERKQEQNVGESD